MGTSRSAILALKRLAAWILVRPSIGRIAAFVLRDRIPIRGTVIDTDSPSVTPEVKARILFRMYESAEIRFVTRWLRRDLDVLELGASLGVVSTIIRKKIRSDRRLVSVEANPTLASLIERNVRRNAPDRPFTLLSKALSYDRAADGTTRFRVGASNASRLALGGEPETLAVPSCTLGELVREERLGPYALVCDIEGAEAGMFLSDGDALEGCLQMLVELHDTNWGGRTVTVEQMRSILTERLGFRLRARYGPVLVLERVNRGGSSAPPS